MKHLLVGLADLLDERATAISRIGVALIILLGIAYSLFLGDELRFADERRYMEIALNLVEHGEFARIPGTPTAYVSPAFPFLLAGLLSLDIPVVGLRIFNFVLLGLSALVLSKLVLSAGGRTAAALVPFVIVGYPLFLYTAGTLYPQTLAGFLLCLFLYFLCHPGHSARHTVAAGVTFGISILAVSLHLLLLPALILWSAFTSTVPLRKMFLVCLLAGLTTLPWLGRNYLAFDAFPLFGTNSGVNLLVGNSENTTPNSGLRADISELRSQTGGLSELERNSFYMERAIENLRGEPSRYVFLYFGKLGNWFNVNPNLATSGQGNSAQVVVLAASYAVLLALVLVRLWYSGRRPLTAYEGLSLLLYVAAAGAYAIFFTRIRFRVPFDLVLAVVAAQAVGILVLEMLRPDRHHELEGPESPV